MREFFEKPIFILAPPRSGSTFLFDCLCQCENLYHLNIESDDIWWEIFPYYRKPSPSDYVGFDESTDENIIKFKEKYYSEVIKCIKNKIIISFFSLFKFKIRILDKTIANCFHLEFLCKAFPDAYYILLVRDPRDNISSMIEGWPVDGFNKPQLKPLINANIDAKVSRWNYPAPPGWIDVIKLPVNRICAWSWEQHVNYVWNFFNGNENKFIKIKYEDLIEDTPKVIKQICSALELDYTDTVSEYCRKAPLSRTTISAPKKKKWKDINFEEINDIIPLIRNTAEKIGYSF